MQNNETIEEDTLRNDAVHILRAVWKKIDWEKIDSNRRRTFQDEFASKIKSATHTNNLQRFLDTLCKKLEIRSLNDKKVAGIIKTADHYKMLNLLRNETVYIILLMRDEGDKQPLGIS